jgi:hypothetical protein
MAAAFFALGGDGSSEQIATSQLIEGLAQLGVDKMAAQSVFGGNAPEKDGSEKDGSEKDGCDRQMESWTLERWLRTMGEDSVEVEAEPPPLKLSAGRTLREPSDAHSLRVNLQGAAPPAIPNWPPARSDPSDTQSISSQDVEAAERTGIKKLEGTPPVPPGHPDASKAADVLRAALETSSTSSITVHHVQGTARSTHSQRSTSQHFSPKLPLDAAATQGNRSKSSEGQRRLSKASSNSDDPMQGLKDLHKTLQQRAAKISASIGSTKSKSPGVGTRKISTRSIAPM